MELIRNQTMNAAFAIADTASETSLCVFLATTTCQMKIQRLLLKEKTIDISRRAEILKKMEAPKQITDKPYPSPTSAPTPSPSRSPEHRMPLSPDQKDRERNLLRAVVVTPLQTPSTRDSKYKDSRQEEIVKSADEPSTPPYRTVKQNPPLMSPNPAKRVNKVKKSPQKFNYQDFLKSLPTPWNLPIVITSYRPAQVYPSKETTFFGDKVKEVKQKYSKINKQSLWMDCDEQKSFRRIARNKCQTSSGLRCSKEKKWGWVYNNDINLTLKKNGLYRKPKTA
ncbi:hypothetical protein HNY73_002058 [Argiope bruennichi]|uniref:Uncharacterized protein n=1 Tax=Argiope bruennichi TaxID=94029 RepID=A0A8T0FUT5_ARGBR|nr:hypothetical protein HNY73_002058 [Argiope bruennichi]